MKPTPDAPTPYTLVEYAFIQLTRDICRALPPCQSRAERQGREKAVIAQVAACHPADTVEFRVAGHFVIASQRADQCLARADEPGLDAKLAQTWTNQANAMMRQADAALRALRRLRTERKKAEADFEASDRAERTEHHLTLLMTHALETNVSSHDPESHPQITETLPTQPDPDPAPALPSPPPPLVRHPQARNPQARNPQARSAEAAQPQPPPILRVVSPGDPKSHITETETHPRHPDPDAPQLWRPARPGFDIPWPPPPDQEP